MGAYGIGPAGAARILADVGDVARFADRNRFASWTGTAPLDASSGAQIRHRLSRADNRRINHVLHIAAVCQIRHDTPAAPTTGASWPRARPRWKPCAACAGDCPTWSFGNSSPTPQPKPLGGRAREGTRRRL
jgi:transposase